MADDASADLVARWRAGDQQAASELFHRYTGQLIALARKHLSAKVAARLDPEDVVQSAYRSFFVAARADRYVLERSGDLWRLLAAITLHKVKHQVSRHTAAKRSVTREQPLSDDTSLFGLDAETVAREPEPPEALAVVEELELVMSTLKPLHRQMVELRLQGHSLGEIGAATSRSERMVRLVLEQVREHLRQRCEEHARA